MRSDFSRPPFFSAALLTALALAGCQTTSAKVAPVPGPAGDFFDNLPQAKAVSNDDALRALLEFGGAGPGDSWESRVKAMRERHWLPADFTARADAPASRGLVAAVLCRMLKIEGGLSMRLWGPTGHYAAHELVKMEILPTGSAPPQRLSGVVLLGVLSQAQKYRETHP